MTAVQAVAQKSRTASQAVKQQRTACRGRLSLYSESQIAEAYLALGLLGQKFIHDELPVVSAGASVPSTVPLLQIALAIVA